MKRIFAFFALCSLVFATEEYRLEQEIDNRVEAINARKGIEIGGTVRSASFNSHFESPDVGFSSGDNPRFVNRLPDREIVEFVQLDLDFKFRPYDVIGANLKLRLGAGMQEYFAAAATTVNVPWLNIEGNQKNFYWVVGDFRQLYSPLTLYMPGLDIMYEPTIFARKREMAQKEALMEGNQRNLQGFNLQFRPQLGEALGELRAEALGARLRRAGYLDASGAMGNILPNEGIPGATQAGRFDKFLLGGNLEMLPLNKNLLVGGTYLAILDDKSTSRYYICEGDCSLNDFNRNYLLNTLDSLPQKTFVYAGRAGADIAGILKNNSLVANFTGEFAMSDDKVYTLLPLHEDPEDESSKIIGTTNTGKQETGSALLAQMDLGYKGGINVLLSSSFIRNEASWFNNVAQTPSFFARRVLNSDKDKGCISGSCFSTSSATDDRSFNLSKYGVYSPLYSSFDALYFFTPKFSPMSVTLTGSEPGSDAQTRSYNIAPYAKTSWSPSTLTRAELVLLEELSDLNLQMALPSGFATSNRQGFQEVLTVNWKNLAEVKGLFANYQQLSAFDNAKEAKYTEYGGGAKVDVLGIFGFEKNPLELSGSYKHSAKEQEWNEWGTAEFTSDFINAGLYYRFFRRFGLTFGYQQINSDLNIPGAIAQTENSNLRGLTSIVPIVKAKQNQWMVGLDYTMAKNAWLSINYGIMNVENTYKLKTESHSFASLGSTGVVSGTNLPDYLAVSGLEGVTELKHDFSRNILEAIINVEF
ncbi:MAG: hypothetical protein LBU89_01215 [Fibromonadaceae bacterium]|jgi:hypothetical protein|nr:hypothetical protein [Fibromonadaceae bacterium]